MFRRLFLMRRLGCGAWLKMGIRRGLVTGSRLQATGICSRLFCAEANHIH